MKVRKLIIELKEMNPEADVALVVDNGEFTRIVTSEEHALIKGKGGPTWERAVEAWPDAA